MGVAQNTRPTQTDWNMVTIPNEFNYIWMGNREDKFRTEGIASVKAYQPNHKIHLWIDVFSMMTDDKLQEIFGSKLWNAYDQIQPDRSSPQPQQTIPATNTTIEAVLQTLRDAQKVFSRWLSINKAHLLTENSHVSYFVKFCRQNKVTLHFLDLERYCEYLQDENSAEHDLMSWVLFERYARGGNFGAATDLLRIQLLIDRPGLYVDHDDFLVSQFASPPCGFVYTRVMGLGLPKLVTNCFLGSCEDHPFLPAYRAVVLRHYANLIQYNFKCVFTNPLINYTTLRAPTSAQPTDPPSQFELETLHRSGPTAMAFVYSAMNADGLGLGRGWMENVQGNSAKSWLNVT